MKAHIYQTGLEWTGNRGEGTVNYTSYDRSYKITVPLKPDIPGSSDPAFRGDRTRYNPEELLVAALSSCHMLWYLHLCAQAGVVIVSYRDNASGEMLLREDGGGQFTKVTLQPQVTVTSPEMVGPAQTLHAKASEMCFIANSVNFEVVHDPDIRASNDGDQPRL